MLEFTPETIVTTGSGAKVKLREWMEKWTRDPERVLYIGTDSQQSRNHTRFTSVIVSHEPGKGGVYCYVKYRSPRINSLRQRLLTEAWQSVALAMLVTDASHPKIKMMVHLDVNKSLKFKSGQYMRELVGMVTAQGFGVEVKPGAWAASRLADRIVKGGS